MPLDDPVVQKILLISALYVFALAAFLGYQVISRVPPLLHTPLMSATNAITASRTSSIVTAGAHYNTVSTILVSSRSGLLNYKRCRRLRDHRVAFEDVQAKRDR
jgi:hypothetical protein